MRSLLAAALLSLPLVSAPAGVASASTPIPPRPVRWVTDSVGFLSPGALQSLDQRLQAWERASGHQFVVWIGPTSGDWSPEDFATKAFESWGVGRKDASDGLALFVFSEDRKVRFEVGYGLEGTIPDAVASRIVREAILPRLAAGDRDGAITAGVDTAIAVVSGEPGAVGAAAPTDGARQARPGAAPPRKLTKGQLVIAGIVGLLFLVLLVTNPRLAIWLLINIVSSSGGRGSSSGGGSWSGGGGRSGGGGATGSW